MTTKRSSSKQRLTALLCRLQEADANSIPPVVGAAMPLLYKIAAELQAESPDKDKVEKTAAAIVRILMEDMAVCEGPIGTEIVEILNDMSAEWS